MRDPKNLINVNRHPGRMTVECFNFPLNEECFANWVVRAWRGSCQASGIFICVAVKIAAEGADLRVATPP